MVAPAQLYASFWFDRDDQDRFFRRLGRTLTVSLALHLVALLVVMGLRLTPHGERPLAAVEVNLVNLPTPVKTVEQPRPVEPVKRVETRPSPAPVPVRAPAPPVKALTPTASLTTRSRPPSGPRSVKNSIENWRKSSRRSRNSNRLRNWRFPKRRR